MTYKGSNWTRGELGHAPDRNPSIPCDECGDSFSWQDYWQERIIDGDRVEEPKDPDSEPWRCDECHERHERLKRRKKNNQELQRFTE